MMRRRDSVLTRTGLCGWLLVYALSQEAGAVLTNYINRPIMSCGAEHALMLKSDGTVWVWGNDYQSHQFGGAIPPQFGNPYSLLTAGIDDGFKPATAPRCLRACSVRARWYRLIS